MDRKIRFIHTADLHLGAAVSTTAAISAERKSEALLTLEKIFSLCREKSAELLLVAGDLLDNNAVDKKYFDAFIRATTESPELTVIFAAGNHDPLTADSPFLSGKLPENLIVLETEDCVHTIDRLGVRIYGRSFSSVYMAGENRFSLPTEQDDFLNIMVQHGELCGSLSGGYNPIIREFVEQSGMDYIALGHVHAGGSVSRLGKTSFAYSGTPEPHGFDELGSKGVIFGELSKAGLKYEFIPTARRTYEEIEVDVSALSTPSEMADATLKTIKERIGERFADNLYKVILTGAVAEGVNPDLAEITTRLAASLYFVKVRNRTKERIDLELLSRENSLKGRFVRIMREKIEAAAEGEKEKLEGALYLGLSAFEAEVEYNED